MSSKPLALILGASNHSDDERQNEDFYATDPEALKKFLDATDRDYLYFSNDIWECACGDGAISKELEERGYNVRSTDAFDRGFGDRVNFLDVISNYDGDIITNPPFKHAEKFIDHAKTVLNTGSYLVLFLKIQFLEGKRRKKLFNEWPPKYVYIHSSRVRTFKNNDEKYKNGSGSVCYAWYIWQKGTKNEPKIRWID